MFGFAGSFLQSSEAQLQNNVKVGKSRQNGNVGTMSKAAKQQKVYHTKYFIIKSLNHHNLAKSIEKGIWATQAMNEPVLNEAFEVSTRLDLLFGCCIWYVLSSELHAVAFQLQLTRAQLCPVEFFLCRPARELS